MNFKELVNKTFNKRSNEITEEENAYISEFKTLFEEWGFEEWGSYGIKYNGIPRFDRLLGLLNITEDDPIAKAVNKAWKEHFEYNKLKDRLRNIMSLVEPPQFDKYAPKLKEFEDITDEELAKLIEKYETKAVKSRDVKALRELSDIVNNMHSKEAYWN